MKTLKNTIEFFHVILLNYYGKLLNTVPAYIGLVTLNITAKAQQQLILSFKCHFMKHYNRITKCIYFVYREIIIMLFIKFIRMNCKKTKPRSHQNPVM